jgi:hypothetical protein
VAAEVWIRPWDSVSGTRCTRENLDIPAAHFRVSRIHAEQVAGENRRLVTAGAGAYFQEGVTVVSGVFRYELFLQFQFQLFTARLHLAQFLVGHGAQVRVGVVQHFPGRLLLLLCLLQCGEAVDHRVELRIFHRQGAKALAVGDSVRVCEQGAHFAGAFHHGFQLALYGRIHGGLSAPVIAEVE